MRDDTRQAGWRPVAVLLGVCVLGALASTHAQAPAPMQAVLRELDGELTASFADDAIGGVAIGVVVGGELAWTHNLGYADMEAKRPTTSDTAFRIGSITKQFTALALLQAAELGFLRVTDPVEQYVPELRRLQDIPANAPPITLLQVATMMSGLAREPRCDRPLDGPVSQWTTKLLECLPGTSYANDPGTEYLYSNVGYAILGLAIERAVGRPFTEFVEERTFKPLGMTRTAFELTPAIRQDLGHGYSRPRGRGAPADTSSVAASRTVADRELEGRGYKVPNGAILSTVTDMAKFLAWELGAGPDGVLDRETQAANYRRVYSASSPRGELTLTSGYGLGFQASRSGDVVILGHGGATAGYHASALFHRQSTVGVVVLRGCDSCRVDAGPVARRILLALVDAATAAGSSNQRRD